MTGRLVSFDLVNEAEQFPLSISNIKSYTGNHLRNVGSCWASGVSGAPPDDFAVDDGASGREGPVSE